MKTRVYARLVLLIPLLIWMIFLLVGMLINAVIPADLRSNGPNTFFGLLEIILLFYVIGILFWFLPYLVLSTVLLLVSFKSRLNDLKYLFFLSPFAMAILVMLEVTILSLATGGIAIPSDELVSNLKTSVEVNLLFGILALVWGYICVVLGLGGYKLLQHFGRIKEEEKINSKTIAVASQV
jgi:hypothetical protein